MANRKYRSREEWQALIDRQMQSGCSVTEFCKQHCLTPKYFYRKRGQLRDAKALVPTGGAFVRVSRESSAFSSVDSGLVLRYRDSRLQLPTATDAVWLAELIKALS